MSRRSRRSSLRRKHRSPRFGDSVFINCPFDSDYWPIFEAIVFTVFDCGFAPQSALQVTDSGTVRILKLRELVKNCKYAFHDLSRIELSPASELPRFNMPFELGLDLGARFFGTGPLRRKECLILEGQPFSYLKTLSDIAGQDILPHRGRAAGQAGQPVAYKVLAAITGPAATSAFRTGSTLRFSPSNERVPSREIAGFGELDQVRRQARPVGTSPEGGREVPPTPGDIRPAA